MSASILKYFYNYKTLEEVKATYKQLAKQDHPDLGGDTATMQTINTEYAYACATLLDNLLVTITDIM